MARQVCEGCNDRFFTDDDMEFGDKYCSYCIDKVRQCPICKSIKLMQRKGAGGLDDLCSECKLKYHAFPNIYLILRFRCFERDNFTCAYCGRSPINDQSVTLHCDHIIPRAKGGEDRLDNLTTSCAECNSGKMDVMLSDYQLHAVKNRGNNGQHSKANN